MIKSFKHKGLKQFFEKGTTKGIRADHVQRLRKRLAVLDAAVTLDDIKPHNWNFHSLQGERSEQWAINVSGNWRLFFKFENGSVYVLDYNDYH